MTDLLTDEIRAKWIGHHVEVDGDEITESMIKQFVYATEDDHPAYLSDGSASEAGVERLAPPLLYQAVTRPYVPLSSYNADGTTKEIRPIVGSGQSMGGTLSTEFVRPLRVGDRLSGVRTLVSMDEKKGARRQFVLVVWETEYRDQNGELIIRERYEQIIF